MASGEAVLGTWVTVGNPDVPDILEELGFDWLLFDMEHAPLTPSTVAPMVQAIDAAAVCPLVRVGGSEPHLVKAALDLGAHGVLYPLVNSASGASRAVSLAKYPPAGVRGVAPRKAASYGLRFQEYFKEANELTMVAVQVETREALASLDGICSQAGVDIVFAGPTDLGPSLGLGADRNSPALISAMEKVVSACRQHGKVPGTLAATPEEGTRALKMGFRFVGLGSDTRFLIGGARQFLDAARAGRS